MRFSSRIATATSEGSTPPISRALAPGACIDLATLNHAPSQKELAAIFGVTTRHLRRWEREEDKNGRPCSRPYSAADLWHLYQRRFPKGWDRTQATRLHLASLLEKFDEMLGHSATPSADDEHSTITALMLKSLAWDGEENTAGAAALPASLRENLARAAKQQLRAMLDCRAARDTLTRAYFEAALLADGAQTTEPGSPHVALSA